MKKRLGEIGAIKQLAEKLNKCECVSKFDSNDEPEAWRLAHSLSDLEQSFAEVLEKGLPALCGADNEEKVQEALLDIGEELRHILYHIRDPRFYSYLDED